MSMRSAIRHLVRSRIVAKQARSIVASLICVLATPVTQGADEPQTGLSNTLINHVDERGRPFIALTTHYAGDPQLSLVTTYAESISDPLTPPQYHQLDQTFWGIQADINSNDTTGRITTEIGYGGFSAVDGEGFGNTNHHFMRIQTSQQTALLRYGMNFQSAGAQFYRPGSDIPADRASAEAWIAQIWRKLRVRSYVNQSYDNLAHDPTRARLIDTQLGTKMEYTMPAWPNLSYAIEQTVGVRHSTLDPVASLPVHAAIESTRISLNYRGAHWNGTLSSVYSTQHHHDSARSDRQSAQQVKGTVHLSQRISLHPGVAYTATNSTVASEQAWLNVRYQSMWQPVQVSSYVSQTNTHDGTTTSSAQRHGADISARWRSAVFTTNSNLYLRIAYDNQQQSDAYPQGMSFWLGWHTPLSGFSPPGERSTLRNLKNL